MMLAFPLWLGGNSTLSYAPFANVLAWCFAIPGLVLSYYAAVRYVPLARAALAEGRRRDATAASGSVRRRARAGRGVSR